MRIKRITFALGLLILILCFTACTKALQVGDVAMLEFPGLKWNATPEEVKKNLGLTTDQILVDAQGNGSEHMDTWVLTATDVSFFGEQVVQAQFCFVKYTGYDKFGLESVRIYYPDEADMATIRDAMIDIYGAGSDEGITRYRISVNEVLSNVDSNLCMDPQNALLHCWINTAKGTDVLSQEVQEAIIDIYADPEFYDPADRDVVLEFLAKNPLVTLYCTDSAGEGNISANDLLTCNHVNFSASNYIDFIQRFGK